MKYDEKGSDVIVMGDFNTRIGLEAEEHPSSNRKRVLDLVRREILAYGICCSAVMGGGLGKVV